MGVQLLTRRGRTEAEEAAAIAAAAPVIQSRIMLIAAALTVTDAAAAETEITSPRYRALVDLSRSTQIRLLGNVGSVGSAGTALRLQWSATAGGTYAEFAATNQPSILIDAQGVIDSGWVTIPAGAKTGEVFLRIASAGGNATADPVVSRVEALIR